MKDDECKFYKRDYWAVENLAFSQPHFRLEKCARIANSIANSRAKDLLDLGCGPATLAKLLQKNISYFGIDIAIPNPASNLLELDMLENEIKFGEKHFDIIVASGIFEYMGNSQRQKFYEINRILKDGGRFILTYSNVDHRDWHPDQPWNNVQSIMDFKKDLKQYFHIDRFFASSHNRKFYPPERKILRKVQMNLNINIPWLSPLLAVEYFMICSKTVH